MLACPPLPAGTGSSEPSGRPRVTVLFSGGTICMTRTERGGAAVPTLSSADICAAVPRLDDFDLSVTDVSNHPGSHMRIEDMCDLHGRAAAALDGGDQGVVVVHGTDTLEETAFLLDLLHGGEHTIACTGAMRTRDDHGWDGPDNLYAACMVAASPRMQGCGAVVVMNRLIHAASEVTKKHTQALHTFASPNAGALGIIRDGIVLKVRTPARRVHLKNLPASRNLPRVDILYASTGCDGVLVRAAVDAGARGLVAVGMGCGNVPPVMADALLRAVAEGVPVVLTSRCWHGPLGPVYGYAGGGRALVDGGALLSPWHTPGKTRVALTLALHAGYDNRLLAALFDSPA